MAARREFHQVRGCFPGDGVEPRRYAFPGLFRSSSHSTNGPSKSVSRSPANAHTCVATSRRNARSSRRVTDEDGPIRECSSETAEAAGRDVNLVCTTAGLRAPLRVKVTRQWARVAKKGLARIIAAAAPRLAGG